MSSKCLIDGCQQHLKYSVRSFYFFRPLFRKKVYDLSKIDKAVDEPENVVQVLKGIWRRAGMLWLLENSRLTLLRNNQLVYTLNFKTNPEDTHRLAELISLRFSAETLIVHP